MKRIEIFSAIIFSLLFYGVSFGQTAKLAGSSLVESHGVISFKPIDIMQSPETLMKIWINEPIPICYYSEVEKQAQNLINVNSTHSITTYSPLGKDIEWTDIDYEEITPFTWKWVDLELRQDDGSLTKISLLRPHRWIQKINADKIGSWCFLSMPESGTMGWARVSLIRINQLDTRLWNDDREGDYVNRPVTGKFVHESDDVYHLWFDEKNEPLGVTGFHPIWSTDRNGWIPVIELRVGENVRTLAGESSITGKEKLRGRHEVYNLEIYRDHNFLVHLEKVLVHNNCFGTMLKGGSFFPKRAKDLAGRLGISESQWHNSTNGGLKADLKRTLGFNKNKKVSSKYGNNPDFGLSVDGTSLLFRPTTGKFKGRTFDTGLSVDDVKKMVE